MLSKVRENLTNCEQALGIVLPCTNFTVVYKTYMHWPSCIGVLEMNKWHTIQHVYTVIVLISQNSLTHDYS